MKSEGPLVHLREHSEIIAADLELIKRYSSPGGRILDMGAGRGSFVKEAQRQGFQALALDVQREAAAVWLPDHIPGVVGDGAAAPFYDSAFDVVRMKEIIEHVQHPLKLVKEARRLLQPGGLLIAHVPTPYSQFYPVGNFWDDYTHVRPLSRFGLRRLMEDAGLLVVRIDGYMAGRNSLERAIGRLVGRIFPHIYLVIARLAKENPDRTLA